MNSKERSSLQNINVTQRSSIYTSDLHWSDIENAGDIAVGQLGYRKTKQEIAQSVQFPLSPSKQISC